MGKSLNPALLAAPRLSPGASSAPRCEVQRLRKPDNLAATCMTCERATQIRALPRRWTLAGTQ